MMNKTEKNKNNNNSKHYAMPHFYLLGGIIITGILCLYQFFKPKNKNT